MSRRIIQITAVPGERNANQLLFSKLFALCADGSLWCMYMDPNKLHEQWTWYTVPAIPEPAELEP